MRAAALKLLLVAAALVLVRDAFAEEAVPTEFVTQVLEPTGGKIERPKDWFYHESHNKVSYTWILSKEDAADGHPYDTGVRIQVLVGIKEGTGKTAEQFIRDFIANKSKEVNKVVKTCEPTDQEMFTRLCLETEEGRYHILYSLFWGRHDLDMVVVSIAGTPKELWPTYSATFDRMSRFELIDLKRFEN